MTSPERQLEEQFIEKLRGLKYEYRPDIRDRAALEKNFREKFEALNRVRLTDGEFQRLLDEIISPDVFASCLSSLDDQITAEAPKRSALQAHKKGLMQQLFPSPEGD